MWGLAEHKFSFPGTVSPTFLLLYNTCSASYNVFLLFQRDTVVDYILVKMYPVVQIHTHTPSSIIGGTCNKKNKMARGTPTAINGVNINNNLRVTAPAGLKGQSNHF